MYKEDVIMLADKLTEINKNLSAIALALANLNYPKQVVIDNLPKVEEPKVEEPKVEEPKVEEPKVEEPKVEEPKVEEPKVEEPKVEEVDIDAVRNICQQLIANGYNKDNIKADIKTFGVDTMIDLDNEQLGMLYLKLKATLESL